VAADGEAEDEDEDARFVVVVAVREVLARGRLLEPAVAGEAAAAAAGRLGVPAGVPPLRESCLAAQPKTRWASRI
jgi:hypothetical protein